MSPDQWLERLLGTLGLLGWADPAWSPFTVAALLATATTVLLALPVPAAHRLDRAGPAMGTGPPGRIAQLLAGRPGAAPLRRRLVLSGLGAAGIAAAAGVVLDAGPAVWLTVPVLTPAGAALLGRLPTRAAILRQEALIMDAPQALELLAAGIDAGLPVRRACRVVVDAFDGPVAEDLGRVVALVELGSSDAQAWRSLHDHPQFGPPGDDLARSVDSGILVVGALRQHAAQARQARESALQVRARAVGVRTVLPLMVCFIPSFLLLGVVPSVASALRHAFG